MYNAEENKNDIMSEDTNTNQENVNVTPELPEAPSTEEINVKEVSLFDVDEFELENEINELFNKAYVMEFSSSHHNMIGALIVENNTFTLYIGIPYYYDDDDVENIIDALYLFPADSIPFYYNFSANAGNIDNSSYCWYSRILLPYDNHISTERRAIQEAYKIFNSPEMCIISSRELKFQIEYSLKHELTRLAKNINGISSKYHFPEDIRMFAQDIDNYNDRCDNPYESLLLLGCKGYSLYLKYRFKSHYGLIFRNIAFLYERILIIDR